MRRRTPKQFVSEARLAFARSPADALALLDREWGKTNRQDAVRAFVDGTITASSERRARAKRQLRSAVKALRPAMTHVAEIFELAFGSIESRRRDWPFLALSDERAGRLHSDIDSIISAWASITQCLVGTWPLDPLDTEGWGNLKTAPLQRAVPERLHQWATERAVKLTPYHAVLIERALPEKFKGIVARYSRRSTPATRKGQSEFDSAVERWKAALAPSKLNFHERRHDAKPRKVRLAQEAEFERRLIQKLNDMAPEQRSDFFARLLEKSS